MTKTHEEWQHEVDAKKKGRAEKVPGLAGCLCGATELVYADESGVEVVCGKCGARRELRA